jgi:photosystem II stability/assembly factor-like uncharacterized protein
LEFWIAADDSVLLHSTNGGGSWSQEILHGTYATINGVALAGTTVIAVGEYGFLGRKTSSSSWVLQNSGTTPAVNWLAFADAMNGMGVGQWGFMIRTADGGKNWTPVANGITGDSFYGAAYVGTKIWVAGDLGVVLHSSDRGEHWAQQTTGTTMTLLGISFTDEANGWAVGDGGMLLRTFDGGTHWIAGTSGTTVPLYGITMRSGPKGWLVGESGAIRHSANGTTWAAESAPVSTVLWSISFADDQHGYAAGGSGVILHTTDAGGTWLKGTTGTMRNIYIASGASGATAYAIGDTGLVLSTSDGGSMWAPEYPKTSNDLFGLHVLSDTVAWISGDNGSILCAGTPTITGPVNEIGGAEGKVPSVAMLHTNFPNPFNPSTTLRYIIPAGTHVVLKAYTVLGQELATLVDEWQPAGVYQAGFDADAARMKSSGLILFRLETTGGVVVTEGLFIK